MARQDLGQSALSFGVILDLYVFTANRVGMWESVCNWRQIKNNRKRFRSVSLLIGTCALVLDIL